MILAWIGLKVKVVGQRSRANMKIIFLSLLPQNDVKIRSQGHHGPCHQGQGQRL